MVRYDVEGRARAGGASSFLADRVEEEGEVRVFIEHNDNFRLPANPETPVIMIGPGLSLIHICKRGVILNNVGGVDGQFEVPL